MLAAQSLNGCLHFLILQSVSNWINEGGDGQVKYRKKLTCRITIEWESIDKDSWAKEESDHSDVSR